ncbi:MAG: peptide chain release factor N(5)-glutamine methyltransferase, partial [Sandaracinaceae bacterium]|nr:peptide chain release factor N(5)-glutamine methyltransferase [Sandaracinaceae bacterium]
ALEIFKDLRPSRRFDASQLRESAERPHAGPAKEKFERRLRVVDVGTGSGAIGLTLACEIPSAELTLIDRSHRALMVARRNLERLAKDDSTLLCRVRLLAGDLLAQLGEGERFDLIVANLPYLSEKEWASCAPEIVKYEPREALVGGPEGHELILRLLSEAPERLNPRGVLLLEIGHGQGQRIIRACQERGYSIVQLHRDLGGRERVIEAHWTSWP